MRDLKTLAIRGGFARLCAQGANFVLRAVSLVALARLLGPKDFGLVGMVTAFTGVLAMFRDFGLSTAAVQRTTVTDEQISTLFWINLLLGALLALMTIASAPAIAAFYGEHRLLAVTSVLALGFLFNAAGVQHTALLQRQMRFTALSVINVVSLVAGIVIGLAAAVADYGYWALVAMSVASPLAATVGAWLAASWVPGMPRKRIGIQSMLHFGGAITLSGLVMYVAHNAEKVLIGRVWGADAIGIYGRAYQVVSIPADSLNSAVGEVALSALSRLQGDPVRLRSYFLKGFSMVLGLTLPATVACVFFADDVVFVLLGPKWEQATAIVRLLAPTIALLAIMNPLGWLVFSMGQGAQSLKRALVFAPLMIAGYVIGLPYGPEGVALGYSVAMTLRVIPHTLWCIHGLPISFRDVVSSVNGPLASSFVAGGVAYGARQICDPSIHPLARLALESGVLFLTYFGFLFFFVKGQRSLYLDLVKGWSGPSAEMESAPVSAQRRRD